MFMIWLEYCIKPVQKHRKYVEKKIWENIVVALFSAGQENATAKALSSSAGMGRATTK